MCSRVGKGLWTKRKVSLRCGGAVVYSVQQILRSLLEEKGGWHRFTFIETKRHASNHWLDEGMFIEHLLWTAVGGMNSEGWVESGLWAGLSLFDSLPEGSGGEPGTGHSFRRERKSELSLERRSS